MELLVSVQDAQSASQYAVRLKEVWMDRRDHEQYILLDSIEHVWQHPSVVVGGSV